MAVRFENRFQAGQLLGHKLKPWACFRPLILALPRGGVPVAYEIARKLDAQMDLLLVKKIGAPGHDELALGAIAEQGEPFWNEEVVAHTGLTEPELEAMAGVKRAEIGEQSRILRAHKPALAIHDRVVILVDDGLATGSTMIAAIRIVREQHPGKIVVAAPVGSSEACAAIRPLVDELVVAHVPEELWSVGLWYGDFTQVADEDVQELLKPRLGSSPAGVDDEVEIPDGDVRLCGRLTIPAHARAVIVFAHGTGSTHKSPRNVQVAKALRGEGFGTLLFDLLSESESLERMNVFDIELLARRLRVATEYVRRHHPGPSLPIGYFGGSTGAVGALTAAAQDASIFAVVSRGGRPDLAKESLGAVQAPTLLIVGGDDVPMIPLNRWAREHLASAELVLVPGATHLFTEPGSLDKVVEYASGWFTQCLKSMPATAAPVPVREVVAELRAVVQPFSKIEDLHALVKNMSRARVVMLGEATHGTDEFYECRRLISQSLIEDYGFAFIAVEGDWPDCIRLNQYISGQSPARNARAVMRAFKRWPTWMWANEQMAQLIEWMKGKNVGFYGLDVFSLHESLAVLKGYASRVDDDLAAKINSLYSCFEPYERSEIDFALSLIRYPGQCQNEAVECLREMARARIERTNLNADEFFDARLNARVLRDAERYYRAMTQGGEESWNIRDSHMMDTLDVLLQHHGEGAKGIVWAHNTHIGDYKATRMVSDGYVNLGGLARERYGSDNIYLLGFGTYQGEVLAGRAWDASPEVMALPPAREGSIEAYLHQMVLETGSDRLFFELNGGKDLPGLSLERGHRAIGVVYQPEREAHGHNYVPSRLARRYDGFVFVDKTRALTPISRLSGQKGLIPESWPMGQ